MGYSTDFSGYFSVQPPLDEKQVAYLIKFSETRRMKRDPSIAEDMRDPVRQAVGLPIGDEGGYFTGGLGMMGQDSDESVVNHICHPDDQPGLWCQWFPTEDGSEIIWDGNENFYDYTEWLKYIVEHFLEPWGRKINGEVHWQGKDSRDSGIIYAKDNMIEAVADEIKNPGPSWSN